MIVVVMTTRKTPTGATVPCVSHGIDYDTMRCVPLGDVDSPLELGAKWSPELNEYILDDQA